MYKRILTKQRLPKAGGYYSIELDEFNLVANVHWSIETQKWTTEDMKVWDADYPMFWLEPDLCKKHKIQFDYWN